MKKNIKYQLSLLIQITLEKKVNIYWKNCFNKLGRSTNQKVNFVCRFSVTKISFFTSIKHKLNKLGKSNVAYQFSCPGRDSSYIGKIEQALVERTKEHVTRADSASKGHFDNCLNVKHLFSVNNLILNDVNTHKFMLNRVRQNTGITNESNNWNVLLFKEAFHIKANCPIFSNGVKVSRKMQLFWMQFSDDVYANHVLIVSIYSNLFLDFFFFFIKLV